MKSLKIVIFGPYKSGTTGLFYKVRNSLPGEARTLFEPNEYRPQTGDDTRWVLAKTILGVQDGPGRIRYETFMGFDRKLSLVRDPRDLLISGLLFMMQQEASLYNDDDKLLSILTLLKEKESSPASISVYQILKQIVELSDHHTFDQAVDWLSRQYRWLMEFESGLDDHYLVKYEDFVDDRISGLETYLGLQLSGPSGVDPIHDHVPRTMGYNNWKNWFLKSDVHFFKPLFEAYIRRYNYPSSWDLNERQIIPPEHGSKYIERTVNKKRKTLIQMS
jgi:hypothetical protein